MSGHASPEALRAHVKMISETLSPRDHLHVENLDRVAAYVRGELAKTRAVVGEQPFSAGGREYRNVLARFGPETGPRMVVGAHYDSCEPLPAADDNASGVAGLIELARLLDAAPALPCTVELVAFTLEEPPHFHTETMGSAVHARALKAAGVDVRAMISIEMIGYFSDAPGSQHFPSRIFELFYPTVGNFIAVVGKWGEGALIRRVKRAMAGATSLPVRSLSGPRSLPGVDFSDHASYWDEGFPAVMVTDTAFFRNVAYHTAHDTADRLSYDKMGQVVDGIFEAVSALAR